MAMNLRSDNALTLRLFGPADIRLGDDPLPRLRSQKGVQLLALLALRHDKGARRDWLAGTLWPESDESLALYYLRRELSQLRKALGTESVRLLARDDHILRLDLSGANCDIVAFDAAVACGDPASLAIAVTMYRGPFLQGCTEEWAIGERESRELTYLGALEALASHALSNGDLAAAIERLRDVILADPLRESAQRALMGALAESGDTAAAIQVYRTIRVLLRDQINAEPDPATTQLFQSIRDSARRRARAPRPRTPTSQPAVFKVPRPLTPVIGREREIEGIRHDIRSARLVTLIGTGGVGKTRIAVQVAEELNGEFVDGIFFVDLAPLSNPSRIPYAIAQAMGLRLETASDPAEDLVDRMRGQDALLVLDNCEHLIDAAAKLADLILRGCHHLRILATSREPLGLTGETNWQVPPMQIPPSRPDLGKRSRTWIEKDYLSIAMEYESVKLFAERATQARRDFSLKSQDAEAVAQICCRLDGIPLAIELAASLVRSMPVTEIAARLCDRFSLLTGGSRAALPRQQTLQAAIDWSYDQLSRQEQLLLNRLAVFAGGSTLEAAQAVCACGELQEREIAQVLRRLVDKSLVLYEAELPDGLPGRYRLLETLREYAAKRLEKDRCAVAKRHAEHYREFADLHALAAEAPKAPEAANYFEADHENLRLALQWFWDNMDGHSLLQLSRRLNNFWITRGHFREGREWTERALMSSESAPLDLRASGFRAAGRLAARQADYAAAEQYYQKALQIERELGNPHAVASLLNDLGAIAQLTCDYPKAHRFIEKALAANRELGEPLCVAMNLGNLGLLAADVGQFEKAMGYYREGLDMCRTSGSAQTAAEFLNCMGLAAREQADVAAASAYFQDALCVHRANGDRDSESASLHGLGLLAADQGERGEARALLLDSLAIRRELGLRRGIAESLEAIAWLETDCTPDGERQWAHGVRLMTAAQAIRDARGFAHPPFERKMMDRWIAKAKAAIGGDQYETAWAAGRAMGIEEAIEGA